jgi:hypothetical protein
MGRDGVCRRDAACECQPTVTLRSLSPCARRPFACSNLAGQIMGVVQYNDEARSSRQAGVAGGGGVERRPALLC